MKNITKKLMIVMLMCISVVIIYGLYGVLKTADSNNIETVSMAERKENIEFPDIYIDFLKKFGRQQTKFYYAFIELENYEYPILLLSDGVYEDNQSYVAMWTDVYYYVGGEVIDFGNLLSGGTAYPIAEDKTGIYISSGHSVAKYNLNMEEQKLQLVKSCTAYFNSKGEVTYVKKIADDSKISTAKECEEQNEKYADAKVIYYRKLGI